MKVFILNNETLYVGPIFSENTCYLILYKYPKIVFIFCGGDLKAQLYFVYFETFIIIN